MAHQRIRRDGPSVGRIASSRRCRAGSSVGSAARPLVQRTFGFVERSRAAGPAVQGGDPARHAPLRGPAPGNFRLGPVPGQAGSRPGRDGPCSAWSAFHQAARRSTPTGSAGGSTTSSRPAAKLRSTYAEYDPPMRRLLDYAGLDPDHALLRWGNFDRTLYLPSTVFEPDDTGRSYRFRPDTRSIWVRNLKLKGGILAYFPIPVGPRLAEVVEGTGALVVETSVQTTNSWGLRGPEPDTAAPLRGIVLGDSYMQGLFVARRPDPQRVPEARARRPGSGVRDRGPQHRPSRLLARAGVLHAPRVRRPVPAPVRRPQPLRQRLRRPLRGPRGQGRLGGRQVLAGPDHPVLQDPPARSAWWSPPPGSTRSRATAQGRDSTRA